ncbi:MAG: GTP-binding protein [Candidatus Hodarchaeales archaeon]|jgi:small GTP-binding protein
MIKKLEISTSGSEFTDGIGVERNSHENYQDSPDRRCFSWYATLGADFAVYQVEIDEDDVKFQIWDLAGQNRYDQVRPGYYQGVMGCLLVYDILRRETLDSTPYWVHEISKYSGYGAVPIILIGNKIDLRSDNPIALQPKHGRIMAERINGIVKKQGASCSHSETSAKTGENVDEIFKELARTILNQQEE